MKKAPERFQDVMKGKVLVMIFEKPSLRTRVSFETGAYQMGGDAIFYDFSTSPLGAGRESIHDTVKTLSRYTDFIMARLFEHEKIQKLALGAPEAIFMNCLPSMRGYEQTAEVIDGAQSEVFDWAENRLHAQKAIMATLLEGA